MDSYRYLNRVTRTAVKAWIKREPDREIPWTPLRKPLARCTVTLVSSAAVAMRDDQPFDQDKERRDPWHPDESYRLIPRDATEQDVHLYHLHINTHFGEQDLDCVMPLRRLKELEEAGEIGRSAQTHYSFQGFVLKPHELLEESVPTMIERMKAEEVDVALLVPVWPFCCRSVGLVQREIEAAGISTISLSMIPEFTRSVGAPRIAAIAYPMAHPLGAPGDHEGQMAVLKATLQALEEVRKPGEVVELPFEWPERPSQVHADPEEPPPIAKLLTRRPWLVAKFLSGDIPEPKDWRAS